MKNWSLILINTALILYIIYSLPSDREQKIQIYQNQNQNQDQNHNHDDYIKKKVKKEVKKQIKKQNKQIKRINKQIKKLNKQIEVLNEPTSRSDNEPTGEVMLISYCTEAEAANQGYQGKTLVVDVILNRMDSDDFPDTAYGVIYQKDAFEVVSKGMIYKTEPAQETIDIVQNEMKNRTNKEVLFFTAGRYNPYCEPMFKLGDHYFGK